MNDHIRFIKERRSIRNFKAIMPKDEEIIQIIESAGYAPSPTNLQPWKFLIIKSESIKRKMVEAVQRKIGSRIQETKNTPSDELTDYCSYFTFFQNAPVIIVPLYKPYPSSVYAYLMDEEEEEFLDMGNALGIMSASAATQNLLLAAHSLGLGGCWMHGPLWARAELREILGVKEPWEILAIVPIGVPAVIPKPPRRKRVRLIVKFL
jgi:nitroreductase